MSSEDKIPKGVSRRDFIKGSAVAAIGVASGGLLAGCGTSTSNQPASNPTGDTAEYTSWDTPPPSITDSEIISTLDTDVVVVGAGNAGIVAAVSAAEKGAKVILVEKMATYFIGTAWMGVVNSSLQKKLGYTIDRNKIVAEVCRYASHLCDQRLVNLWADKSGEVMDWYMPIMEAAGLEWVLEHDVKEGFYPSYPIAHVVINPKAENASWNAFGSIHYMPVMEKKAKELGVDIRYKTSLEQLIKTDERVTGIIAKDAKGYVKINAKKGVILCTGGYARNEEMLKQLCPDSLATSFSIAPLGAEGQGIKAALWAGAATDSQHVAMIFDRGLVPDGVELGPPWKGTYWQMGSQPFLRVNVRGERFVNESLPYDFVSNAALMEPERIWWQVFDGKWKEDVVRFHTTGCSRLINDPGAPRRDGLDLAEKDIEIFMQKGLIKKADTIEELLQIMNVPADTFKATVARYNELAKKGKDTDFGKDASRLSTLEKPPFYAVKLSGLLLCTLNGLRINTDIQVLDKNLNPIPGLYAAGNDAGGFFAHNYPEMQIGSALGRTMTFARLAGLHAVGQNV